MAEAAAELEDSAECRCFALAGRSRWDEEVEQRLAAYDRGEIEAVDGEEVLARARRLAQ